MVPPTAVFLRHCALVCLAMGGSARAVSAEEAPLADFHAKIQPLLVQYCYDCHGDGAHKGKVAFDGFKNDHELIAQTNLWAAALKNVRAGIMPPDDEPRPTPAEVAQLENWIKYQAFGIDPAHPDPGRVTVRRLNRVEYRNTIRDLMGHDFNSEVEFPPDDTGHGFDNLGEVLTVSPLLLEKYLQAAEEIVDQAVPRVAKTPAKRIATGRDFRRIDPAAPEPAAQPGNADDTPRPEREARQRDLNVRRGGRLTHTFTLKESGTYQLALEANVRSSFDFDTGRATLVVAFDDSEKLRREIVWDGQPVHLKTEQLCSAGSHLLTITLEPLPPLAPNPPDPPPRVPPPEILLANAGGAHAGGNRPRGDGEPRRFVRPPTVRSVDLRISSAELRGPMDENRWVPSEVYARFFPGEIPLNPEARDAYAEKNLRAFATRAFRRPVDDAKVAQLVTIARRVYTAPGARFEDGIARAMMAVLASPRFLFRIEAPAPAEAAERFAAVDEYALASRLSYFLWSSMPDEELLRLAGRGELRVELPRQVARMVKDPKTQALVRNFPGQWLQARDIETVPINARAVLGLGDARGNRTTSADMDSTLRKAMRSETEMVFEYVLREDRSVLEFIEADYTFLNAKLATHYGLPAVEGENLRRVTLPAESPRGGFLTQGSILAVTSNPTRTSPVKRGLFVLENFLGTPPPPPPPDIPALEESQKSTDGKELTLREALAVHRSNALCASCHARMDPLGFALENFNAMGMWRDLDAQQRIDPAGKLITGEPFADIRELKRILTHERRLDYYRCLTEKMLTYALGRGLDYYDVHTVDEIVANLEKTHGRFSTLLTGIIDSAAFQKLRTQPPPQKVTQLSP